MTPERFRPGQCTFIPSPGQSRALPGHVATLLGSDLASAALVDHISDMIPSSQSLLIERKEDRSDIWSNEIVPMDIVRPDVPGLCDRDVPGYAP